MFSWRHLVGCCFTRSGKSTPIFTILNGVSPHLDLCKLSIRFRSFQLLLSIVVRQNLLSSHHLHLDFSFSSWLRWSIPWRPWRVVWSSLYFFSNARKQACSTFKDVCYSPNCGRTVEETQSGASGNAILCRGTINIEQKHNKSCSIKKKA